ncbi:MAG: hypothetical protein HY054_14575 [Proteobacteria bacterium]|nr:hypothetical protein [Pseudomonadota bacterium]
MKWLIILIIVAGIAGYFTRPDESKMREAANAILNDPHNLGQLAQSAGAGLMGERSYDNYYVAARYRVIFNNDPVVTCYGLFTQVQCSREQHAAGSGANP